MKFHRKIVRVQATDSPNVRYAMSQRDKGKVPDGRVIVPGVLPWTDYLKRLKTWDAIRIQIGIHAWFYEGAEVLLFPPDWLDRANRLANRTKGSSHQRRARAMGVDPGEGKAKTSMAVVDEYGVIEIRARPTADTAVIRGESMAMARQWGVVDENAGFDAGGGGKQIADELRAAGHPVRTIAFGEAVNPALKRGKVLFDEKVDAREEKYAYFNRRAQMYGELSLLLDPSGGAETRAALGLVYDARVLGGEYGFTIPSSMTELRRQLAPIPKMYDSEGRLKMLPKSSRTGNPDEPTLEKLLGCSPDEADSVVLAVHIMLHKSTRKTAGAVGARR